ncbi:MAG TPA: YhfC family glutamic-type intramembrane protease [Chloroflexota bacterium]|nr:YhfC family glutamic-type intramembrane protease [Chloroflexota bacterium]HUM71761.1 YhfC family glutamic-type intramembrane protease [Chloroflexota bacterium]
MIAIPIGVGWLVARRLRIGWHYFAVGMGGFVLSQVFHIPFNWLVLQRWVLLPTDVSITINLLILSIFLGLSAGVFEEVTRWAIYRSGIKDARTWGKGMMYGAGWGGIEAILLGGIGLLNFAILLGMQQGHFQGMIPAGQAELVTLQIEAMFGLPWYMTLLGAIERVFAICLHLALSVMVLQCFVRRNGWWLMAAILWHATVNATAVFTIRYTAPLIGNNQAGLLTEAVIAVFALVSLAIIFWLRTPEPGPPVIEPLPLPPSVLPFDHTISAETLEKSKYS